MNPGLIGRCVKKPAINAEDQRVEKDVELKPHNQETDAEGNVINTTLGITRIPDPMLIKEMLAFYPGLNVDRLVAFSALVAFVRIQESNRGYLKRTESDDANSLDKSKNLHKLKYSPFRNIGRGKTVHGGQKGKKRSAYKNFR